MLNNFNLQDLSGIIILGGFILILIAHYHFSFRIKQRWSSFSFFEFNNLEKILFISGIVTSIIGFVIFVKAG